MTPVARGFSWGQLVELIVRQAPDKELVCLVHLGWTSSEKTRNAAFSFFTSSPMIRGLSLMRFLAPVPGAEQVIIRAWFMRETVSQITATNLFDLAERLSQLARQKGLTTVTVD